MLDIKMRETYTLMISFNYINMQAESSLNSARKIFLSHDLMRHSVLKNGDGGLIFRGLGVF